MNVPFLIICVVFLALCVVVSLAVRDTVKQIEDWYNN